MSIQNETDRTPPAPTCVVRRRGEPRKPASAERKLQGELADWLAARREAASRARRAAPR